MNKSTPILVTGATGYIAGWIIERLLNQGYKVNATVRDPSKTNKIQHLYDIAEKSSGQIQFFKADLLDPNSFDDAMQGCEVVIHTASPFVVTNYKDAVKDIIEPAVKGTENVLNSVNRTESVKRVVLTSSIASTYGDAIEILDTPNNEFDENDWNNTSNETHQPYSYSKVAAERKAWEIADQQTRWSLVCINPALVMGPSLTDASQSGSIEVLQQFGNGTTLFGVPPMWNGIVDVRDVADAHVKAALDPQAKGRYIICGGTLSLLEMGKALTQKFGYKYPFPHFTVPKTAFSLIAPMLGHSRQFVKLNMGYPIYFNAERSVNELGIQYRDIRESVCEHFQQLLDDGIVKKYI
ncbi:aldehyde reductase [Acinetobacter venetianus]|uniref:SDR family oxidoreductase n=1 Tax=Acinetobacter venetianus TaxID=52133 RepID=UPI00177C233D|nr:aldehyde reductase [Acinetobacter venetianus]